MLLFCILFKPVLQTQIQQTTNPTSLSAVWLVWWSGGSAVGTSYSGLWLHLASTLSKYALLSVSPHDAEPDIKYLFPCPRSVFALECVWLDAAGWAIGPLQSAGKPTRMGGLQPYKGLHSNVLLSSPLYLFSSAGPCGNRWAYVNEFLFIYYFCHFQSPFFLFLSQLFSCFFLFGGGGVAAAAAAAWLTLIQQKESVSYALCLWLEFWPLRRKGSAQFSKQANKLSKKTFRNSATIASHTPTSSPLPFPLFPVSLLVSP